MTYGTHALGVSGYGGGSPGIVTGAASYLDMGTGTSAWTAAASGTGPALLVNLTGSSAWAWAANTPALLATQQLAGSSGWRWTAEGYLNVPVAPVPPPVGSTAADNLRMIEHVYRTYTTPFTIGADGNPDPSTTFTETRADWGWYMVEINGQDVTYLRGVSVHIGDIEWQEPYDDARCELYFPQVSVLEAFGTGDLAALKDHVEMRIWRILPNGSKDTEPEFEGFLALWGHNKNKLTSECKGVLHQIDLLVRAPGLSDIPIDIGSVVPFQWSKDAVPSYIGAPVAMITTGITTRDKGAWDKGRLNYTDRQLKRGVLSDGRQYTIKKRYPMQGYMTLKDTTTIHFTLQAGIHGVNTSGLQRDLTTRINVWYAEGEDEAGTQWRNSYPTADGLNVYFQPLSFDPVVHPLFEGTGGAHTLGEIYTDYTVGPYDASVFRIEGYANFGQGWNKVEAKRILDGVRARMSSVADDWLGEVVLTTDPPQMSRRKIRPGMNFTMPFHGTTLTFHVAGVRLSDPMGKGTVSLTVDTLARDVDEIQNAIDRKADAVTNPVKPLLVGRESAQIKDKVQPWDTTRGDGFVPRKRYFDGTSTFAVPLKKWTVQRFTIGEEEDIAKVTVVASAATRYHVSFCDRPPKGMNITAEYWTGVLSDWPVDPFMNGAWLPPALPQPPVGQLMGYGSYGQSAGFYPGSEVNPVSGITGVLVVENEWPFTHSNVPAEQRQPTYGWMVVWNVDVACNFYAKLERVKRVG